MKSNLLLKKFICLALCIDLFSISIVHAQPKLLTAVKDVPADDEVAPIKIHQEGATVYSLSEAIKKALTVSPGVESAQFDLDISQAQLEEANAIRILPQVDLKLLFGVVPDVPPGSGPENNFPKVDTGISDIGPFVQVRAEAYQPIYTFGKIKNLRKAALEGVDARSTGVDKAKNELIFLVKRAYIGLTTLYSFKDFLEDLKSRSDKAKEVVDKMIQERSSTVTDIDVLRIQVFQAETERRLIEVNNGIDFALVAMRVLLGLPRNANIDIADHLLRMDTTVVQPVDTYIEIAKENRPEILQLENLVNVREATMKVARSSFFPALGLAGFYRFSQAPGREELQNPFLVDDFNTNTGGGFLVLSQSLSFHLTNARLKQAKALYDKTVADQQYALQGIEVEIRKAYTNAISKQQSVDAAKRAFKSGRGWVLAASLNFGVGVTTPRDLIEAFIGYSTVKVNYLQTLNDYYLAMADLSKVTGKEVTSLTY